LVYSPTIVGLRSVSQTVLATGGLRLNQDGSILRHRANRINHLFNDQVLYASTLTEFYDEQLIDVLNDELTKCSGDCRVASRGLLKFLTGSSMPSSTIGEVMLGSKDFLGLLDNQGSLVEPDEGILAIGGGALIALGAAKALLEFTNFGAEQIARESLVITAKASLHGNDQIFLRSV
jgi:ATP-dependent HslUV protease subunit HslV